MTTEEPLIRCTPQLDRIGVTWAGTAAAAMITTLGFLGALAMAVQFAPVEAGSAPAGLQPGTIATALAR